MSNENTEQSESTTKTEVIEHLIEQLDEMIVYVEDLEVEEPDLALIRRLLEDLREETESLLDD
jgi:hypothetical protein